MTRTTTPQPAVTSNRVRDLSGADLADFSAVLRGDFATRSWMRRGAPRADIEAMEARNVISGLAFSQRYKQLRDGLLARYDVNEFQLVCAGLLRIRDEEVAAAKVEQPKSRA